MVNIQCVAKAALTGIVNTYSDPPKGHADLVGYGVDQVDTCTRFNGLGFPIKFIKIVNVAGSRDGSHRPLIHSLHFGFSDLSHK